KRWMRGSSPRMTPPGGDGCQSDRISAAPRQRHQAVDGRLVAEMRDDVADLFDCGRLERMARTLNEFPLDVIRLERALAARPGTERLAAAQMERHDVSFASSLWNLHDALAQPAHAGIADRLRQDLLRPECAVHEARGDQIGRAEAGLLFIVRLRARQ